MAVAVAQNVARSCGASLLGLHDVIKVINEAGSRIMVLISA